MRHSRLQTASEPEARAAPAWHVFNPNLARYHCKSGDDVPELLDYGFMTDITRASVAAQLEMLGGE